MVWEWLSEGEEGCKANVVANECWLLAIRQTERRLCLLRMKE